MDWGVLCINPTSPTLDGWDWLELVLGWLWVIFGWFGLGSTFGSGLARVDLVVWEHSARRRDRACFRLASS